MRWFAVHHMQCQYSKANVRDAAAELPDPNRNTFQIGAIIVCIEKRLYEAPRPVTREARCDHSEQDVAKWLSTYVAYGAFRASHAAVASCRNQNREHRDNDVNDAADCEAKSRPRLNPRTALDDTGTCAHTAKLCTCATTSVPTEFMPRSFPAKRWFRDEVIIRCVTWYFRFKLSYRDLAAIMRELGVRVAPSTILRWVIRYSIDFAESWCASECAVGGSWRCDETYIKVNGRWMYLYRVVDERGRTVESHFSRTRDVTVAKAFFRKAFRRHGQPRTITLDGFEPSHAALRRMGIARQECAGL